MVYSLTNADAGASFFFSSNYTFPLHNPRKWDPSTEPCNLQLYQLIPAQNTWTCGFSCSRPCFSVAAQPISKMLTIFRVSGFPDSDCFSMNDSALLLLLTTKSLVCIILSFLKTNKDKYNAVRIASTTGGRSCYLIIITDPLFQCILSQRAGSRSHLI